MLFCGNDADVAVRYVWRLCVSVFGDPPTISSPASCPNYEISAPV